MHGQDLDQPMAEEASAVGCRYDGHLKSAAAMAVTLSLLAACSHAALAPGLPQDSKGSGKQLLFVPRELVSVCPCGSEVSVGWHSVVIARASAATLGSQTDRPS